MRSSRQVLLGFLFLLTAFRLCADEALPPPQFHTVVSRNFDFEADSDPRTNETIVYNRIQREDRQMCFPGEQPDRSDYRTLIQRDITRLLGETLTEKSPSRISYRW